MFKRWLLIFSVCWWGVLGLSAQDTPMKIVWDDRYDIPSLNLSLLVNSEWRTNAQNDVYTFTQTQADLEALLDSDPATTAQNTAYRLIVLPLAQIGIDIRQANILDITRQLLTGNLTIEHSLNFSVAGRRAIVATGINTEGRGALTAVWTTREQLFVLAMGVGAGETYEAYGFTFGAFLGGIRVLGAQETSQTITDDLHPLSYAIPQTWLYQAYANQRLTRLFANRADRDLMNSTIPDKVFSDNWVLIRQVPYADLNFTSATNLVALRVYLQFTMLSPQYEGEFFVGGEVGVGMSGAGEQVGFARDALFIVVTLNTQREIATFYVLHSKDNDTLQQGLPTFLQILNTVTQRAD
jgi:hypothetical protein